MKVKIVITSFNEQKNIEKCIDSLLESGIAAEDVIVIDSGSTDQTRELLAKYGVHILVNKFHSMAVQRNIALSFVAETYGDDMPVLIFDADERFSKDFFREVFMKVSEAKSSRWKLRICRKMFFNGAWMKAASNFPVFIDRGSCAGNQSWVDSGHGEAIENYESVIDIKIPVSEVDEKGLENMLVRHVKYAKGEALVTTKDRADDGYWTTFLRKRRGSFLFLMLYCAYLIFYKRLIFADSREQDYALIKLQYEINIRLFQRYE